MRCVVGHQGLVMFSFRTTAPEDQLDKALLDGRVGCFCTQNCWDTAHGRYMYDLFTERGNLKAVLSPMGAELTPGTNHISFDAEALTELDAIVVEIQDAGVRYFNYTKDVFHLMVILAAMENPPSLYIVDHINPAGVLMRPCTFTPSTGRYEGQRCNGYQIMLQPGTEYHSLLHTLQLMRYFRERYSQFELLDGFESKIADHVMLSYLQGEIQYQDLREHVKLEEQKWIRKAKRYSLYDDQPYRIK